MPPIRNRGHFCKSKGWDAGEAKNQLLNSLGYMSMRNLSYKKRAEYCKNPTAKKLFGSHGRKTDQSFAG